MKREDLGDLTNEQKDLVMSLYGKAIQQKEKELNDAKENLKSANEKINTYETKLADFDKTLKENSEFKTKYEDLERTLSEQAESEKKAKADKDLTDSISNSLSDKQFTNDIVKNAIIGEIKKQLSQEGNIKGINEIFEEVTKDKEGILINPNKPKDMPPMNETNTKEISREAFQKMSYLQRVELKQNNPDLYEELRK